MGTERTAPSGIAQELPRLLDSVVRPGDFYGSGEVPVPVTRLVVDGVGLLGLPVPDAQARALVALASPAPYGRGPDTLIDPDVRRCWQIEAGRVHADDPRWRAVLDEILVGALRGLGVTGSVRAELYKLLVYEEGGFFVDHRDTEKAPGMFATLVVCLPSEYRGGELVVRHGGREAVVDMAGDDLGVARWAAFYADCVHEVRPVRSGHRLALVYNLIRKKGPLPDVPDDRPAVAGVAAALRRWAADPEGPIKVVLPLDHHYTPAEISFGALKNGDAAVAGVVVRAAAEAAFTARLGMVSITESGIAEPTFDGYSRGRYRRHAPESYEAVEVTDRAQSVDDLRRPDNRPEPLGPLPFLDEEVAPPGELADESPDEESFHEATGNEGASFERTYRRAALILWPEARWLGVVDQAGTEGRVRAIHAWAEDPEARPRALDLARMLVDGWPRTQEGPAVRDWRLVGTRRLLLRALAMLGEPDLIRRFVGEGIAAGDFDPSDVEPVEEALARLEIKAAHDVLRALVSRVGARHFAAAARLVHGVARARPSAAWRGAVGALVDAAADAGLAFSDRYAVEVRPDSDPLPRRARALVDALRGTWTVGDTALADRLVAAVLSRPRDWPPDEAVVPAAIALLESPGGVPPFAPGLGSLRTAAGSHLRARASQSLAPPADAARSAAGLGCRCGDCGSLRSFLASRTEWTWSLKAPQDRRGHLEGQIASAGVDLDCRTERRGSPHTLVCTKNQRSHEARVRQRQEDLAALARLGGG